MSRVFCLGPSLRKTPMYPPEPELSGASRGT
jgi:hypothetical protein